MTSHAAHIDFTPYMRAVPMPRPGLSGEVTQVLGMLIEGTAPGAAVGDLIRVHGRDGSMLAEVVALKGHHALLMPFGQLIGIEVGARLQAAGGSSTVMAGPALCGRVINALGQPLDGKPHPTGLQPTALRRQPLTPMQRRPVTARLATGVRALDAFVPVGQGQRLGIFSGPGVGKSTLLGMIAKATTADVVVLGLIGERGREVSHFVDEVLGPEGLKRAVVVVATSDRPASERIRAALAATAIAESFREQGKQVLLFVDSLTRLCMAQREIGLAIGEPPTTKGYPPSVFGQLPQILERVAPARSGGSITGLYTVLVEGDDMTDPIADAARGLLDGHIILSRPLALRGHFPAIDILQSLSRLEGELATPQEIQAARKVRGWLATHEESKELIAVGAYRAGADPALDVALKQLSRVQTFLQQDVGETLPLTATRNQMVELAKERP